MTLIKAIYTNPAYRAGLAGHVLVKGKLKKEEVVFLTNPYRYFARE